MRQPDFKWDGRSRRGDWSIAEAKVTVHTCNYQQNAAYEAEEEAHSFKIKQHSYNTVVKIGMVGLGFMGATHLAAFSKIPEAQVTCISTQSERSLAEHLSQAGGNLDRPPITFDFSGVRHFTHWRELVLNPEIDAVDICLPTDLHATVSIAALMAGKHVLCEKPMALTAADCDRMLATAEERKRVLMIGHVLRFWPEYEVLADFVRARPGAVVSARFVRSCGLPDWSSWLPVEARSGGAVVDLLVHDIDQALRLFGMPERVAATQLRDADAVTATLNYEQGLNVQIEGGWLLPGAPFSMGFQAKGESELLELGPDGLFLNDETGRRQIESPKGDAYDSEIAYFIECCRTGNKPELCPPEQSAEAVKLALLVKESRRNGGEPIKCSV